MARFEAPIDHFYVLAQSGRVVLKPASGDGSALEIDRATGNIQEIPNSSSLGSGGVESYGLVGIIKLLAGKYLIHITGRKLVGRIEGKDIYKITKTEIVFIGDKQPEAILDEKQFHDEKEYKQLLEDILGMDFYYSAQFDLTNTRQRDQALNQDPKNAGKPLYTRADERFFWNRYLSRDLISKGLHSWVLPVMMGYIQIEDTSLKGKSFKYVLISRRNWKRAGTRFFVRGVDVEGNVANNVETEQSVITDNQVTAFVITRGSIPVYWTQTPTLKYAPKISLSKYGKETELAFRRHFEEQVKLYGKHTLVNLVNQHGSEGLVANAYHENFDLLRSDSLRYIGFDFHHHCKGMKYENLDILLKDILPDFDKYSLFAASQGNTTQQQQGTFRVNCIDNLDRTNVVQTMIAREALTRQLQLMNILSPKETFASFTDFNFLFKNIWANNGDAISFQYSGTGALKNDFTRTGKRDARGAINDGVNSLTRYYLNNFKDGRRQDSFELFLGNYAVDPSNPSPFSHSEVKSTKQSKILVIGLIIAMMVVTSLIAPVGNQTGHKTVVGLFWLVALFVAWQLLVRYGKDFVNHPRLRRE